MKISVIIPCYNMAQFLPECLESVFSQTLKDIEILCIDDGSTDGTWDILLDARLKHPEVCIKKQGNLGSGPARNSGLQMARGEYIAFMDADDFYPDKDVLEVLYNTAKEKEADICGGSACNYRDGVISYDGMRKEYIFDFDGWVNKMDFATYGGYWRFIFNRELIIQNHIMFPEYKRCQDPPFFLEAIACAGKVYCMRKVTYCYRKVHKRVKFNQEKAMDYAKGIRDSLVIAKRENMTCIYELLFDNIDDETSALLYRFAFDTQEARDIIHEINELRTDEKHKKLLEGKELENYLKEINHDKQRFLDTLRVKPKVLVYGAGTLGRRVMEFLTDNGIIPESFVVTDKKQNAAEVDGKPIKGIDEYISEKEMCHVVIATFPYIQESIRQELDKRGFRDYCMIDLEKFNLFQQEIEH